MIKHLSIDIETFSSVDIKKAGMYAYTRSPDFEVLLFAYSFDGVHAEVVDIAQGELIPDDVIRAITDPDVIKHAYNAGFEILGLSRYLDARIPADQWQDTMLHGLYCGYTAGLDATGRAIGLPEDKRKLATGKALIRYFCVPCKPTKTNGGRTRNLPKHDPEKWTLFKEYNAQDVITEWAIEEHLSPWTVPAFVQRQWLTDMAINSRGVAVDMDFVNGALALGGRVREELMDEAKRLSGLANPNSRAQLLDWINEAAETDLADIRKDTVSKLLEGEQPESVRRMLEIRQELGKTSTKKYDAIEAAVCDDGRVRGLLQYYGANRTGRWAGRLVQVQNLPRTYTQPLDLARELVKTGKLDALRAIYGAPNDTLSQLIRTAFVAAPGRVLIDADFSAIEARVIAWLAGEEWRLETFRNGGDIYCASASQMFGVPVVKGGENGHLRQKGKVAELALGYQGGTGALIAMGALDMGIPEEDLPDIVARWRASSPRIKQLWYDMDAAALDVITNGGSRRVKAVVLSREYDPAHDVVYLTIALPSGRKLFYVDPAVGRNRFGSASISYQGIEQDKKRWTRLETYGGKLVENCVQAIARDCLAQAIDKLEAAGFPVVFHVHDEVVIDMTPFEEPEAMLEYVVQIMAEPIPWAPGLPLDADGWVGQYFKKD